MRRPPVARVDYGALPPAGRPGVEPSSRTRAVLREVEALEGRERTRFRRQAIVAIAVAAGLVLASILLSGCCSSSRVEAVAREVEVGIGRVRASEAALDAATVPHASYGPEGVAAIASLRRARDEDLAASEDLLRALRELVR